jgi:hypothetical protein
LWRYEEHAYLIAAVVRQSEPARIGCLPAARP